MKKIKRNLILMSLIASITSCSSLSNPSTPLALNYRTLRIHPTRPGLYYQYQVCAKKLLFVCMKKEWVEEFYDLNDNATRKELIDMGFEVSAGETLK